MNRYGATVSSRRRCGGPGGLACGQAPSRCGLGHRHECVSWCHLAEFDYCLNGSPICALICCCAVFSWLDGSVDPLDRKFASAVCRMVCSFNAAGS